MLIFNNDIGSVGMFLGLREEITVAVDLNTALVDTALERRKVDDSGVGWRVNALTNWILNVVKIEIVRIESRNAVNLDDWDNAVEGLSNAI